MKLIREAITIKVDMDVYSELRKRIKDFSDTPNIVLRRILGLDLPIESDKKIRSGSTIDKRKSSIDNRIEGNKQRQRVYELYGSNLSRYPILYSVKHMVSPNTKRYFFGIAKHELEKQVDSNGYVLLICEQAEITFFIPAAWILDHTEKPLLQYLKINILLEDEDKYFWQNKKDGVLINEFLRNKLTTPKENLLTHHSMQDDKNLEGQNNTDTDISIRLKFPQRKQGKDLSLDFLNILKDQGAAHEVLELKVGSSPKVIRINQSKCLIAHANLNSAGNYWFGFHPDDIKVDGKYGFVILLCGDKELEKKYVIPHGIFKNFVLKGKLVKAGKNYPDYQVKIFPNKEYIMKVTGNPNDELDMNKYQVENFNKYFG